MRYLRGLWRSASAPRRCPICGEPWHRRDDWLLHVGLDHPVWGEAMLGRINREVFEAWWVKPELGAAFITAVVLTLVLRRTDD